ncbi:MAG TPA: CPBP family intramembrane glutamic endopeptidase [Edaphobacter sp.]|nr:CPBP family intramembrane glutamic endopeptidase [Edaphobacter sp.]
MAQSEDAAVAPEAALTTAGISGTTHSRSAQRDLVELGVGYALILATVWTPNPTQRLLYWLAVLWIIATTWASHEGWTALGLTKTGLLRSLWVVGAALLCFYLAVAAASRMHMLHRLHGPTPILSHAWGYLIWAVMQQFLMQSYFLIRLLRLLPGKALPAIAAAGMFSLAHLPNPVLTPITLVWGIAACLLFLRYRNIYTLGLAHGILGLCVAVTVPNSLHHHMRVGLGYLRYHPRDSERRDRLLGHHRSQIDHSVSTEACVTAEAPTRRC